MRVNIHSHASRDAVKAPSQAALEALVNEMLPQVTDVFGGDEKQQLAADAEKVRYNKSIGKPLDKEPSK